jgi:hypothetical protein
MCDAIFGPVALMALAAGGGVMSAVGGMQAANAQADAQEAQGKAMAQQAGQQQDAANAQAERIRAAGRRQAAEARAAAAAGGVSVDAGTPVVINQEITRASELDALNTIISGGRESTALTTEAANMGSLAGATRSAGKTQAFGTLMSSAGSVISASGWRSNGPGFSGTQKAAPIVNRSF